MQAQEQGQEQEQGHERKPPGSSKFWFWLRAVSFALLVIFACFVAFFFIKSSTNSAYTLWGTVFVIPTVFLAIIQIIPIIFGSQSAPTTIIQHFYPPAPSPGPDTNNAGGQRPSRTNTRASRGKDETAALIFPFNQPHLPALNELFGRERERETLLGNTRNGVSTSIIGPRRIGKTWLVDYLKLAFAAQQGVSFQVADLDGTMPDCKTVSEFTARVLAAFGVPAEFLANRPDLGLGSLGKYAQELQSKDSVPVLCIDEFEGFLDHQAFDYEFYKGLRHIAQNDGLVLVIASKRPLIELIGEHFTTSGLYNVFHQLALRPFTRDEAQDFVEVKGIQAKFTAAERARVLRYGQDESGLEAWPPLRLQLAGNLLLTDKRLAERGKSHLYRPADAVYWREFEERLEETYRGVVR